MKHTGSIYQTKYKHAEYKKKLQTTQYENGQEETSMVKYMKIFVSISNLRTSS